MHNFNTSLKYFPFQNPHNNLAIAVVLNEKIFQTCITLIFQNSNLYLSKPSEMKTSTTAIGLCNFSIFHQRIVRQ